MRLDPRRNLAATAAGILGVGLFAFPWVLDPTAPVGPFRLALLVAAVAGFLAGSWPSRRVRFVLLVPIVPALAIIGIVALEGIGLPVLLVAGIAAYGLLIEYAREGRR